MSDVLFNSEGQRLYLDAAERARFLDASKVFEPTVQTFCHTLHYTGCRISEALNTMSNHVMLHRHAIVFETLKKRRNAVYREAPECRLP